MSRTYKTRPTRIKHPETYWEFTHEKVPATYTARSYCWETNSWVAGKPFKGYVWMPIAGVKTKKKRHDDTEYHWQIIPSLFTRLYMNRPDRNRARIECRKVIFADDYEEVDIIDLSKQVVHYW